MTPGPDTLVARRLVIAAQDFDLVIFDLDGVVANTAKLHAAAWKQVLDDFLRHHEGRDFHRFGIAGDYRKYVNGKPRLEGIRSFLESRGIYLPQGKLNDLPMAETVWGLGNAKNQVFLTALKERGVEIFPSAIRLIRKLKNHGIAIALVTASRNSKAILEAANITELFDVRIDGNDASLLGLRGKPAPDTFLQAARLSNVDTSRAVVIEDSFSGVEAGHAGGFGLVIGLDRTDHHNVLLLYGADLVVSDLSEIGVLERPPIASAAGTRPNITSVI